MLKAIGNVYASISPRDLNAFIVVAVARRGRDK